VLIDETGVGDELDRRVAEAHAHYADIRPLSRREHDRACAVLPGGNTRSVLHFEPFPFRVARAEGGRLIDLDGHSYVDFCGNYTAGLLGHSPERVRDAVIEALGRGWSLGAVHTMEADLAELLCQRFASMEQVRFTNSGTEANLMAIGTALAFTGRPGVAVFDRAYHGGVLSFGPDIDGPHNPLNVPHHFRPARFDDIDGLPELFATGDLGCVLIEPVQGAGGCRPASVEFLKELRDRCQRHGVVLIFDEVMTSRLAPGGAQQRFDIRPDMTTLGKYLAGGMTFGAFGGRRDIMTQFDPSQGGPLTQAGTFNNNVVSMSAAVATLRHEIDADTLADVNTRGDELRGRLDQVFSRSGLPMWVTGLGSMLTVHTEDDRLLELYFHAMVADGLYPARRGFMALSRLVTDDDVDLLIDATERWCAAW
jgi:glutamate-1-semialdehyde 2,1-aminomutase